MKAGSISVAVDSSSSSSDWVAVAMPYEKSRRRQLQQRSLKGGKGGGGKGGSGKGGSGKGGSSEPATPVEVAAPLILDIFLFKVTSGTTVSDAKRLTYSDSNCLAIRTLTNGKAYLIMYKGATLVDLLYLDFNSDAHFTKSAD